MSHAHHHHHHHHYHHHHDVPAGTNVQPHSSMSLRRADGSPVGLLRHVAATVSKIFSDKRAHDGALHEHFYIKDIKALDGHGDIAGEVFVAVRIDHGGIGKDVPVAVDGAIELQGMFIPAAYAQSGEDNNNPVLPVLHFTHHPTGFVIYAGIKYQ